MLVLGIIACAFVQGVLPAAFAFALRGIINGAMSSVEDPDRWLAGPMFWLLIALGVTLAGTVAAQIARFLNERLASELSLKINTKVMQHAATLDLPFFETRVNREMLERVSKNPGARLQIMFGHIQGSALAALQVFTLAGLLIWLEPWMLLFIVVLAVPFMLFSWQLAKRRYLDHAGRSSKQRQTNYFMSLLTAPSRVGEIKVLGISQLLTERFVTLLEDFRDQDRKLSLRQLLGSSTFMIPIIVGIFALFSRVIDRVVKGDLSVGDLAMFGGAAVRLRSAVEQCIRSSAKTYETSLHINDLRQFMESQPVLVDQPKIDQVQIRGALSVQGLSFSYPETSRTVLHDISFEVDAGETVAIVGENGSGKSTLAKLLVRLYDPDKGQILLDGIPLRDYPIKELHKHVAMLSQDYGRFEDTLVNNLAFGDWQRLHGDRAELERIAAEIGLDRITADLPDGLDTALGRVFAEHDLSGGQWQLLAAARMLARDAPFIVLDEPTSNIDAAAENRLHETIARMTSGKTVMIISHRFSMVSIAHRILVMHKGALVEQGTHRDLLRQGGRYAYLYGLHERYRLDLSDS